MSTGCARRSNATPPRPRSWSPNRAATAWCRDNPYPETAHLIENFALTAATKRARLRTPHRTWRNKRDCTRLRCSPRAKEGARPTRRVPPFRYTRPGSCSRSERYPLALDVLNERGIAEPFGAFEVIFPKRQRFDQDAGFKQHVEGDACHIEGGGDAVAVPAFEDHGDVGVAIGFAYPSGQEHRIYGLYRLIK